MRAILLGVCSVPAEATVRVVRAGGREGVDTWSFCVDRGEPRPRPWAPLKSQPSLRLETGAIPAVKQHRPQAVGWSDLLTATPQYFSQRRRYGSYPQIGLREDVGCRVANKANLMVLLAKEEGPLPFPPGAEGEQLVVPRSVLNWPPRPRGICPQRWAPGLHAGSGGTGYMEGELGGWETHRNALGPKQTPGRGRSPGSGRRTSGIRQRRTLR